MNPYIIIGIAAILAAYLLVGVPILTSIVEKQGILAGYPLEILAVLLLAYMFAGYLIRNRRLFVLFMLVFLLQDIVTPPFMIPIEGVTKLAPGQQIAGDVFIYTVATQIFALPHLAAWLITYFIIPLMLLVAIAYELKTKRLSMLVPHIIS